MPLSLKAEQKNLIKMFETDDIYVIPNYQRPYSWGFEQCDQLYKDLTEAYYSSEESGQSISKEKGKDYFLGTIILARNDEEPDRPNIVDGQQRMTTLYLIAKIMTVLCPNMKKYKRYLYVEDVQEENKFAKITSDVYETNDKEEINKIFMLGENTVEQRYNNLLIGNAVVREKCSSSLEYNFYIFYKWFKKFKSAVSSDKEFEDFVNYFFRKVYLLPIELDGKTNDEANERAIKIFETLNNRGLSLENADLFKAKLYENARLIIKHNEFSELWKEMVWNCNSLNITVDELFSYYYHILRGEEGIVTKEISLRNYFITDKDSPLITKKYDIVMQALISITHILLYLNNIITKNGNESTLLRIVKLYPNRYPRYLIVAYLYKKNNIYNLPDFHAFLEEIIRISYGFNIQFQRPAVYEMMRDICHGKNINFVTKEKINPYQGILSSSMREGLLLLVLYLKFGNIKVSGILHADKINKNTSIYRVNYEHWLSEFVLLDCAPISGTWKQRREEYDKNCSKDLKKQWEGCDDENQLVKKRVEMIDKLFDKFFLKQ